MLERRYKLAVYCKKTKIELISMLLPSFAGFLLFFIIPFFVCMYYSVLENPVSGKFIGLTNYQKLFINSIFLLSAKNTILFSIMVVPFNIAVSLTLAVLVNRKLPAVKFFRASLIIPMVIPTVSAALFWKDLFDIRGPINKLLIDTGLINREIDFFESGFSFYIAVLLFLWKNIGYSFVLFSAALANIPSEYYDYVKLETNRRFTIFRNITLVYLRPALFFVFIMSIINSFKVFRDFYLISGNYPHDSIYLLQNFMNNSFKSLDYGKLTSSAILIGIFVYFLVVMLYRTERSFENALH